MSAFGRNQPCRCGSNKKTKHCCGIQAGPSESELAKAFLATEAHFAFRRLFARSQDELCEIFDEMVDLPQEHLELQLPLPELLPSELEALRHRIEEDDVEAIDKHVGPALACVDDPRQRAGLARAVLSLRDAGAVDTDVAAAAILDLNASGTSELVRSSLLHALSVLAGASCTPAGLLLVSDWSPPRRRVKSERAAEYLGQRTG